MFFLGYLRSELLRRKSRTILTVLGLAVGVSLVIVVSALSKGLDKASEKQSLKMPWNDIEVLERTLQQ